jgi:hypothetical protein
MNQDELERMAQNEEHAPRTDANGPILFHPDYTVGPGVSPDLLTSRRGPLAGCTAGGELHPALRIKLTGWPAADT